LRRDLIASQVSTSTSRRLVLSTGRGAGATAAAVAGATLLTVVRSVTGLAAATMLYHPHAPVPPRLTAAIALITTGGPLARLAIRFFVGCALIIPMIIQTILLDPSGAISTDEASNVSRPDPSGAVQVDAELRLVIGRSSVRIPPRASFPQVKGYQARRAYSAGASGGNLTVRTDAGAPAD